MGRGRAAVSHQPSAVSTGNQCWRHKADRGQSKNFLPPRGGRGTGGKNLRIFRTRTGAGIVIGLHLLAGDEPYGGSPGGKKICAGNQFGCEGWQEGPVPSEETNQNEGDNQVGQRVGGRDASLAEELKG